LLSPAGGRFLVLRERYRRAVSDANSAHLVICG
jgi:hypothetical protein